MTAIRALIADHQALIRTGLEQLLRNLDGSARIDEAADFEGAKRALGQDGPFNLALVDFDLPGMGGPSGIKSLCEANPGGAVIVISDQDDAIDIEDCIAAGAQGYLSKSSSRDVILGAIRLVLSGGMYLPPTLLRQRRARRTDEVATPRLGGSLPGPLRRLTRRQQEVLELLSLGRSNKEIAQSLGLAEGTVKIHVSAILKALGVANRTEATARTLNAN